MIVLHFIIYGRFVGVFFFFLLCFVNLWKINVSLNIFVWKKFKTFPKQSKI